MNQRYSRKKRIAICRLRQNITYTVPLTTILDSFYECLLNFRNAHPEYEYSYYKFSFSPFPKDKPASNIEALSKADIIIIPTEAEFNYWVPGKLHGVMVERSNLSIRHLSKFFANKRIILLRSDRADNIELYRNHTLKGISADYRTIDEDDFPLGIHGMKYHFIKHQRRYDAEATRNIEFAYWGSDKRRLPNGLPSGDLRHIILKELQNSNISSQFWGAIYGIKDHNKWSNDFRLIVRSLINVRSTLCFNWLDENAATSRYGEALASGVMPFVWKDYDKKSRLITDNWQRISEPVQVLDKLKDKKFDRHLKEIIADYEQRLPSLENYKDLFEKKLLDVL
jgi:hypothetical protein